MMIRPRSLTSWLLVSLVLAPWASARAGDYIGDGTTLIADRCAQFGQGFEDAGNGVCRRVSRSVRVYVGGPRNAAMDNWTSGATSSAAMRTDGTTMVPGANDTQRLRVRGSLDSYNPFR